MEQQQNRKTPAPPESYGKRMWQLWGPLLIKWGIAVGIMMVAASVCSLVYMSANYEATMKAMENQDQMMELYASITEELMKYETVIQGLAALITIPVMLVFFHKDRVRESIAGIVPNKKAPVWKYGSGLLMAVALSFALNNLIVISGIGQMSEAYEETMAVLYDPPFLVQIVCLGILVPVCEELVFRGLMYKRLRERASFLQAALYSSVVFGFLHVNMVQMLYGIILGMMLAYVYEKYGSVKAPVAAHIVMNLFSVTATRYQLLDWLSDDIMRIGIVTVVCAAVAATMFVFVQRIEEKPELPKENEHLAAV